MTNPHGQTLSMLMRRPPSAAQLLFRGAMVLACLLALVVLQ